MERLSLCVDYCRLCRNLVSLAPLAPTDACFAHRCWNESTTEDDLTDCETGATTTIVLLLASALATAGNLPAAASQRVPQLV